MAKKITVPTMNWKDMNDVEYFQLLCYIGELYDSYDFDEYELALSVFSNNVEDREQLDMAVVNHCNMIDFLETF